MHMPIRLASMRERMHALCVVAAQTQHAQSEPAQKAPTQTRAFISCIPANAASCAAGQGVLH